MSQHFHFDPSRSLAALDQDSTIIAVIEMSQSKWLAAAVVPGVERQPLKRLDADKEALPKALHRWRNEAGRAGHTLYASSCLTTSSVLNARIKRIVHELRPTALDADATSLLARSVALPCWYGGGTTSTMMNLLLSGYSSSRRLACAATRGPRPSSDVEATFARRRTRAASSAGAGWPGPAAAQPAAERAWARWPPDLWVARMDGATRKWPTVSAIVR
jgi:hypothetical protein